MSRKALKIIFAKSKVMNLVQSSKKKENKAFITEILRHTSLGEFGIPLNI